MYRNWNWSLRGFTRVLFAVLVLSTTASAQYVPGYLFLGPSTKVTAVGSCGSALLGNAASFFWNPSLACYDGRFIAAEYAGVFGSLNNHLANLQTIAIGLPLDPQAAVQIGFLSYSVDDIPRYPALAPGGFVDRAEDPGQRPNGTPHGWFSDREDALYFALSRVLPLAFRLNWVVEEFKLEIPIGVSFKYLRHSLDLWRASGIGLDAGLALLVDLRQFSESPWLGQLVLAWRRTDISGTRLRWGQGMDQRLDPIRSLAFAYTVGQQQVGKASFLLQDDRWTGRSTRLGFRLSAGRLDFLVGKGYSGLDLGCSVKFWGATLAYARQSMPLGNVERLALEMRW